MQRAVAGYVRGQLLFSVAMGIGAGVGLYLFGVLGHLPRGQDVRPGLRRSFFGLMELIPFVGPFLGALPPMLVALFQDPLTAVWVGLLFVALQQIEGHIVAPQVFGHTLRINPLLVIFALLFGGELYGIVGALLALPTAAIVRETVVYLRRHRSSSRGGRRARSRSSARRTGAASAPSCPACGAPVGAARRLLPALRGGPLRGRARARGARP